jgi:ankyrin repeat protein
MSVLVEIGADVHAVTHRGNTALHLASTTETVTWLLEAGAELNRLNYGVRRRSSKPSAVGVYRR